MSDKEQLMAHFTFLVAFIALTLALGSFLTLAIGNYDERLDRIEQQLPEGGK